MTWTVHKFGGTSVADASCIRLVAGIIGGQRRGNLAVVVSAMKGVTDDLLGLVDKAAKRQPVEPTLKALRARHEKANVELLGAAGAKAIMAEFDQDLADIESILKACRWFARHRIAAAIWFRVTARSGRRGRSPRSSSRSSARRATCCS